MFDQIGQILDETSKVSGMINSLLLLFSLVILATNGSMRKRVWQTKTKHSWFAFIFTLLTINIVLPIFIFVCVYFGFTETYGRFEKIYVGIDV